jgi:hypothetical protein
MGREAFSSRMVVVLSLHVNIAVPGPRSDGVTAHNYQALEGERRKWRSAGSVARRHVHACSLGRSLARLLVVSLASIGIHLEQWSIAPSPKHWLEKDGHSPLRTSYLIRIVETDSGRGECWW